jgi:hypothetical protein
MIEIALLIVAAVIIFGVILGLLYAFWWVLNDETENMFK